MAKHAKAGSNSASSYNQNSYSAQERPTSSYAEYQKYQRSNWQGATQPQAAVQQSYQQQAYNQAQYQQSYGQQQAYQQQGYQQYPYVQGSYAQTRVLKKKKWPKVIGAFVVLLALVLVGVGGYVFMLDRALSGSVDQSQVRAQLADKKSGEPYYILLLGSDAREEGGTEDHPEISSTNEQSDIMVLLRVDEKNKTISMLSIPRDTPVEIDGQIRKINRAYSIGGAAKAVEVISSFTGVPISHYVELHISDFEAIVDDLGGINFYVPADLVVRDTISGDAIWVNEGQQLLNGKQAQVVARFRKGYDDGDVTRQNMVRELIVTIVKTALSKPVQEIPGTIIQLATHVGTDMKTLDFVGLATQFGVDMDAFTVYSGSGPTVGDWREDLGGDWFCYDNPEGWAAVLRVFTEGGDPGTVDANAYAIIPDYVEEQ